MLFYLVSIDSTYLSSHNFFLSQPLGQHTPPVAPANRIGLKLLQVNISISANHMCEHLICIFFFFGGRRRGGVDLSPYFLVSASIQALHWIFAKMSTTIHFLSDVYFQCKKCSKNLNYLNDLYPEFGHAKFCLLKY